jgi:hypothetical protein
LSSGRTRCTRLLLLFLFLLLALCLRTVLVVPAILAFGVDCVVQAEGGQQAETRGPERSQHVATIACASQGRQWPIGKHFVLNLGRHCSLTPHQLSP